MDNDLLEQYQPESKHTKIWRYMDFTKFVSLIESGCLYFTRVDKLEDPFEGSWPRINVVTRSEVPEGLPGEALHLWPSLMEAISKGTVNNLRHNAVNCWHMNEHESAAMWKLYLKSNEGVAVQSTYRRLEQCFVP